MRPVVSQPIYRIRHPEGDTLETTGDPADRVPGVTLDTFRLQRDALFGAMAEQPGFRQLDDQIRQMLADDGGKRI